MKNQKKLLVEYIKLINEDMGGDYAGIGLDYQSGYGMGGGGGSDGGDVLYKAFIKPFADVIGVTAGSTKEIVRRAKTVLSVSVEAMSRIIFPFIEDRFDEIFEEEKQDINQIKSEYAEYYNATWEALNHDDVLIAAFMYRPDLFLTYGFAKKAPAVAASLLSVFTGGTIDKYVDAIKSKFDESLIREDRQAPDMLMKLLGNKKVKSKMLDNDKVRTLSNEGQRIVEKFLSSLYEEASRALSAKSIEDFEKLSKKKSKEVEALKNLDPQKKKKAEQLVFQASKKKIKAFYLDILFKRIEKLKKFGISEDHPFIKVHKETAKKIENI